MWNPLTPVERLVEKTADRQLRQEQELVREPGTASRRMVLRMLTRFCLVMGATVLTWQGGTWQTVGFAILGATGGAWAASALRPALSYRNGWIDGRQDAIRQIAQHEDAQAWLNSIAAYDMIHVLGATPIVPDSLEGIDD